VKKRNTDTYDPLGIAKGQSLLQNPLVLGLTIRLTNFMDEIWRKNHPTGGMHDDRYMRFNEGMELRPAVTVRVILDHLCDNPELLVREIVRREKKRKRELARKPKRK
jgi:hypothetical protein